jgi:hypothetical protein
MSGSPDGDDSAYTGVIGALDASDNAPYMINPVPPPTPQSTMTHHHFPILKQPPRAANAFYGARRAFLAGQDRKAALSRRVLDGGWRAQEKQCEWRYRQQIGRLTANIKQRGDEALRRMNKPRPTPGGTLAAPTTGSRCTPALPRDRQCCMYPRTRLFFFGQ